MSVLVPFNRNRRRLSRIFDEFFNDDFWPFTPSTKGSFVSTSKKKMMHT